MRHAVAPTSPSAAARANAVRPSAPSRATPRPRDACQADGELALQPLAPRRGPHAKGSPIPARRTIEIRGRTVPAPSVPRTVELDRRRPPRRAIERVGTRPDRLALWALLMGIVLILVAVGTADASMLLTRPTQGLRRTADARPHAARCMRAPRAHRPRAASRRLPCACAAGILRNIHTCA